MAGTGAILVAGRSGQLARSLIDLARSRQLALTALGRPELDLTDPQSIERALARVTPSAVINAAAYTAVDQAESEPDAALAINRDGARSLAAAAARRQIPFIHISTDYVFDGRKSSPYVETDPTEPLGAYGRSKLAGETAVLDAHPSALILRASWLYSAYGANFVTTMLRLARTRDVVRVVDDQHGAPTAAADLAKAVLDLVAASSVPGRRAGGVYHLTAGGATTWHGFAAAIFSGWQRRGHRVPRLEPITTADYPTPARRPANSRLDCGKIFRDFGIALPPWPQPLDACLDALALTAMETPA